MRRVKLPLLSDQLQRTRRPPRCSEPPAGGRPPKLARRIDELHRSLRNVVAKAPEGEGERPRTRGECRDGPRPCPWVSCRHHLALDVMPNGDLALAELGRGADDVEYSCALDLAEHDGLSLTQIAHAYGMSRQRVEQLENLALERAHRAAVRMGFRDLAQLLPEARLPEGRRR